jgi:hypothetical protein
LKKQILAYITATINQYARVKQDCEECSVMCVLDDLSDLESFVADLKEVQTPESAEIIARYLKRILELEESCKNMCEVEKNLQKRIDKLTGPTWVED